ncbi:MAG TPA: serine/threonine-protein kinase, partial [Planctomycetota bacterium]|nr:serine/threonine-protein kinase [Planctomycetota bacterium]
PMVSTAEGGADALEEALVECLERSEREGEAGVEAVLAAHPEQRGELEARIRALRRAGLWPGGPAGEPFPERLGEFRLLRRIGGGGMGVVYLAEQTSLGRRVALKLIRPEQLYFPGARERFRREVEAVARLSHPGIVPVHAVGEEQGIPFFAMELVAGLSLAEAIAELRHAGPRLAGGAALRSRLAERAPEAAEAARADQPPFSLAWTDACLWIAREVAQALEHAHQRGVLHRDVKPSNVVLAADGRAVLVDFGLASTRGASAITRTGSHLGSLPYSAPEQLRGEEADARTDVYALGVTLYELLAFRQPYEARETLALTRAILEGRPPRLTSPAGPLRSDVAAVVSVAMETNPERRYPSAAHFARDLTNLLERRPIEARPSGSWVRLTRWAQRQPAAAAAAVLAVVLVVGGPLVFGLQQLRAAEEQRELVKEIDNQRRKAVSEQQKAQASFLRAMDAVDALLTRVGDARLEHVPQAEEVRRELLEDALAFYGRFLEERSEDPEVLLRTARTHAKVAEIRRLLDDGGRAISAFEEAVAILRGLGEDASRLELCQMLGDLGSTLIVAGRLEEAEPPCREARSLARELVRDQPRSISARSALGKACHALAVMLADTGRSAEALEAYAEAIEALDFVAEQTPERLDGRAALALALDARAVHLRREKRLEEAEVSSRRAVEVLEALHAEDPVHSGHRRALGVALAGLGIQLSQLQRPDAEKTLRRALEVGDGLAQEFPRVGLYQRDLAATCQNLGIQLAIGGKLDDAQPCFERAREIYERLAEGEDESAELHNLVGAMLGNVAKLELARGNPTEALDLLEKAIARQERALASSPNHRGFKIHLGQHRTARAQAFLRLGRHAEAAEDIRELELHFTRTAQGLFDAAEMLARCSEVAAADASLSEAERAGLEDSYAAEAVALLGEALQLGLPQASLASSAALAPLRERPGFQALASQER